MHHLGALDDEAVGGGHTINRAIAEHRAQIVEDRPCLRMREPAEFRQDMRPHDIGVALAGRRVIEQSGVGRLALGRVPEGVGGEQRARRSVVCPLGRQKADAGVQHLDTP